MKKCESKAAQIEPTSRGFSMASDTISGAPFGAGHGYDGRSWLAAGALSATICVALLASPALAQAVSAPATPAAQAATPPAEPAPAAPATTSAEPATAAPAEPPAAAVMAPEPIVIEEPGITVTGAPFRPTRDPLAGVNMASFAVTQAIDRAVIEPMAKGYEKTIPEPARDGLHNALVNLREPMVAVNFLLQHKVGQAGHTLARFAVNSTVGLLGIFDVARHKPFHLAHRENGVANTLGFYGVGPGPFMFLPLFGATTLRDLVGRVADRAAVPLLIGRVSVPVAVTAPLAVVGVLDHRVRNAERIDHLRDEPDEYRATREEYMARRRAEIDALRHPDRVPKDAEPAALTP